MNIKKLSAFNIINYTTLLLVGIITLLPVLNLFCKAFSGEGYVIAGAISFWPKGFQLETIKYVLLTPEFYNSFLVSVFVTIVGTFGAMFLTVTMAYPLSKQKLKGRKIFIYINVVIMLFSAGMVPNYLLYRSLNLTNTIWALVVSGMYGVGNMFIVKNYFEMLPESIEEAAIIDGASNLRILFTVILPMSTPVLATVTLYYAVAKWSDYFSGIMYITDSSLKPLQQYLYDLISTATNIQDLTDIDMAMNISGENVRAATIFVSTVPILLIYPKLQKYFVKGITIGSTKG